jgi:thiol-disulfide isomerase/thioredoxin
VNVLKKQISQSMKKLLLLSTFWVATVLLHAQGIAFEPAGTTMEQAMVKAKKEGKMIFVDCYTTWCGPCKKMANVIFPQAKVGDYMNPLFVNLKLDMESPYGTPLAKKWQVSAYPTFIIFNADAKEIGRFMGGSDADGFIQRVKENSRDNGSSEMEARWNNGDRDETFLKEYLQTLNASYKRSQANDVAEALLAGKEKDFAKDDYLSKVFIININNPFAASFIQTVKSPKDLKKKYGADAVENKIKNVLSGYTGQLLVNENGKTVLDEEKFNAFVSLLNSMNLKDADHYRLSVLIAAAEKSKDFDKYIRLIEEYMSTPGLDADDMTLANWVKPFHGPQISQEQKNKMAAILRTRVAEIKSGKRKAQTGVGNMRLSRPTDELLTILAGILETGKAHQ